MITDKQKEKYKSVIGFRYSREILKYLDSKKIKNANGKSYSLAHISGVMNGAANKVVEDAIFQVYKIEKQKQDERKQLLES